MSHVEKMQERLKGARFGFFPGSNPNLTSEQIAEEINKALDKIEAGDFEEVDCLD